jgi:hypothetical protein
MGTVGDNVHLNKQEQESQANDGSTENLDDWGYSTIQGEDWSVYFGQIKYHNGEANALASNVSQPKTVLY